MQGGGAQLKSSQCLRSSSAGMRLNSGVRGPASVAAQLLRAPRSHSSGDRGPQPHHRDAHHKILIDYGASVRRQAWTDTENLSRTLDAALEGKFAQIDLVLQSVADEYRRQLTEGGVKVAELQTILDRQAARLREIAGLRVVDAFGDMRYASHSKYPTGSTSPTANISTSFATIRTSGMVISRPEFGQLINKWIVIFARRLSGPDERLRRRNPRRPADQRF